MDRSMSMCSDYRTRSSSTLLYCSATPSFIANLESIHPISTTFRNCFHLFSNYRRPTRASLYPIPYTLGYRHRKKKLLGFFDVFKRPRFETFTIIGYRVRFLCGAVLDGAAKKSGVYLTPRIFAIFALSYNEPPIYFLRVGDVCLFTQLKWAMNKSRCNGVSVSAYPSSSNTLSM